jgi:putative SOS response-associated peptidase YedK
MCGRFTSSQPRAAIAERFQITVPDGYSERYNVTYPARPDRSVRNDGSGLLIADPIAA